MSLVLSLSNRAAIVTGASGGIGRAIALALAEAGADLVLGANRHPGDAEALAAEVEARGGRASVVTGDLAEVATAKRLVEAARERFGRLDILVNNAGIWEEGAVGEITPEALERTLGVNLKAAFHLCREAVPLLMNSPAGRIINVSSTASLLGEPLHAAYAASKGGLDALTRSLAVELGPHRITVNSVAPGWTVTEMTRPELETELGRRLVAEIPLGKTAVAEDAAYAVVFLASDWAGHVSGVTLPVEGAYRFRR